MDDGGGAEQPSEAPSRVGAPQELGSLFVDAHLAFHADGDVFRAAHTTHQAIVRAGAIQMTPYDWDGVRTSAGAPVEFATASIARGGVNASAAGDTRLVDGSLEIARGGATELLSNREEGLEQSWRFASAPAGDGDLVVAVSVTGHQSVTSNATGLHFMTPGRLGFRYSTAAWIDAAGTTWQVPVSWDGAQAVMRVPGSVLDRSSYPAVLDPTIGAERAVDRVTSGFVGARAREPAISWSGSKSLVVWRDDRSEQLNDIYAARVNANGDLVDVKGILVSASIIAESEPTVTWTGSEWLVAWTRSDDVGTAIAAATVSATGVVTSLGIIAGTAAAEFSPALASAGAGGALLVWQNDTNIAAAPFSGGSFGTSFFIASTSAIEGAPAVAASPGGNYLVAFQAGAAGDEDIRARRATGSGVNGTTFVVSTTQGAQTTPAVAFDGTDYMLAWRDRGDIWGARVSTAGVVLDQTNGVGGVAISANANNQQTPSVACDSGSCLVAWADRRDTSDPDNTTFGIYGQRIGFDGVLTGGEIAISDPVRTQNNVALSGRPSGFTAVWEDQRVGVPAIFLTPIGAAGAVSIPQGVLVNHGRNNRENRPSYAVAPTAQLAVWSDSRELGDNIMARRYDGSGARLDDAAFVVSDAQFDQTEPAVDWDGTQFVVAWQDARNPNYDLFAARFQADGTLSDPTGIAVSTAARNQTFPDLASGGGVSLAVWQDRRDPANGDDVMGAIVAPDGSVAELTVCSTTEDQERPAVAWDPSSSVFVVVWADRRATDPEDTSDVYAARVQPDGTVLDPCGVLVSGAAGDQWMVDIATSGDQLLVVWEDFRSGSLEPDVFGARINTSGNAVNVVDTTGIAIATGASGQATPTVTGVNLGRFGLAWVDDVNQVAGGFDIRGNTMQADGSLEPEYGISELTDSNETGPAFQNGVNDQDRAYLVYQKAVISTSLGRAVRRVITY